LPTTPGAEHTLMRHQLCERLRQLRAQAQLTQRETAGKLGWSVSKLVRIESGQAGASVTDVRALLAQYGISDPRETDTLGRLALASRRQPFGQHRALFTPEHLVYLRYEAAATRLRSFCLLMPDLLQTDRYARHQVTALAAPDTPEDTIRQLVQARMERQAAILHRDDVQLWFILDEASIRRIGPDGEQLWREQLQRLQQLAQRATITIQILPFDRGYLHGTTTSFTLLDVDDGETLLYRGEPNAALHHAPALRARYETAFAALAEASADPSTIWGHQPATHQPRTDLLKGQASAPGNQGRS